MITGERMTAYLNSLETEESPFLEELARRAEKDHVPIIRRQMRSFLKTVLIFARPARILEIGTAVGFSAILMASYTDPECLITTIELSGERAEQARANIRQAGYDRRITIIEGDAAEKIKTLAEPFDFIFLDAAKGQYIRLLPDLLKLLRPGGIMVSDNVLQNGDLVESHFLVTRRDRTIYRRMRAFLYELKHHPELETSVLPLGDGAALSVKKQRDIYV